ncbi:MAG TPA: FRG domain-containing protein [Chthoniobacterales bacterium]|nr:FRG domain-containing protein [Chthoniobacterales bacterium]
MVEKFVRLMRDFANRKGLKKKVNLRFLDDLDRPRVYCDEPAIVARFASQIRQEALLYFGNCTKVLMRGQTRNHAGMVPGLFRLPNDTANSKLLLKAEARFEREIQKIKLGRLKRPPLAALLQHYGYYTSWLDVVDNLWIAVWFATHTFDRHALSGMTTSFTRERSGWIYFIATEVNSRELSFADLRAAHHPLSLRPHTQHGWSVRSRRVSVSDLNEWVIACVEFPIGDHWTIDGYLGSADFFFPRAEIDDTLRRLIDKDVDGIAASIEQEFGLPTASLGRATALVNNRA